MIAVLLKCDVEGCAAAAEAAFEGYADENYVIDGHYTPVAGWTFVLVDDDEWVDRCPAHAEVR